MHLPHLKSSLLHTARQKDKALGSITEVVQTVKHPRSHIESEKDKLNLDYMLPISAEAESINTPGRQTPQLNCSSSIQDSSNKSRKSERTSLKG